MASRYVPPALRGKAPSKELEAEQPSSGSPKDNSNLFTAEEIERFYWPRPTDDETQAGELSSTRHNSTLHASQDQPSKLTYVILFRGANPRWSSDRLIFVKSNLDLLPTSPLIPDAGHQENTPNNREGVSEIQPGLAEAGQEKASTIDRSGIDSAPLSGPIAVYQEVSKPRPLSIRFAGWYVIEKLDILLPNSPQLVKMLDQKWTKTDRHGKVIRQERDAESWKKSMNFKWAVVKFKPDIMSDQERGPPNIERLQDYDNATQASGGKGVNEMLAELRMTGSGGKDETSTTEGTSNDAPK
ncbi:MAG: hypothetical protein M1820_006081 [Bogoriella megaspora]|nr:MAG: hypothetical protein M1820_006081 [Bogoriella megaspora]